MVQLWLPNQSSTCSIIQQIFIYLTTVKTSYDIKGMLDLQFATTKNVLIMH